MAAAGGALTASMVEIPLFTGQNSSLQTQLSNSNSQLANLKKQLDTMTGLVSLSITEQALLEPVVETIIPTDSTGVGAKEAGVIYFIDRQLASEYGLSGNMFIDARHVPPNIPASSSNPLHVTPSVACAFLKLASDAFSPERGGASVNRISYAAGSQTLPAGGTPLTVNCE